MGSDLPLAGPDTDTGISSDRPEWDVAFSGAARPEAAPNGLGDSFAGENHGRSLSGTKVLKCMWIE